MNAPTWTYVEDALGNQTLTLEGLRLMEKHLLIDALKAYLAVLPSEHAIRPDAENLLRAMKEQ